MPKEVEECVSSVLEDNPDLDESSAYAICYSQQSKSLDSIKPSDISKANSLEKVQFESEIGYPSTIFKAGDDFVVWGPASVEVVDKEGDKISAEALEDALPQLLKRARLSLDHSDQIVGRILENFDTDEKVKVEIAGNEYERKEFPTEVLKLDGMEPALFCCGEIFNDTKQSQDVREKIEQGELNSYSISGEALVTRKKYEDGEAYNDVVDIDLSAITICEEGMNQKAKFTELKTDGEKKKAEVEKSDEAARIRRVSGNKVGKIAKRVLNKNMTEKSLDMEKIEATFEDVVKDSLPDGELATKDDVMDEEDVQEIVEGEMDKYRKEEYEEENPDDDGKDEEEIADDEEKADDSQNSADARDAATELADEYNVRPGKVLDALDALANDEEKADDSRDYEEGEEEVDVEEGSEEEDEVEEKGYSQEELKEKLPDDVYEVVSEYLELEMGDDMDEDSEGEEMDYEEEGEMNDDDVEKALKRVLGGQSPGGNDIEKDRDINFGEKEDSGSSPALANFYPQ